MTKLDEVLAPNQQDFLAQALRILITKSCGSLTITVKNGHVRFLNLTDFGEFPEPEKEKPAE